MTPETFMFPNTSILPFETFRSFAPTFDRHWPFTAWKPLCDIYETDKEIVLKMELPEMRKEDVHVTFENNVLTLRGERKFEEAVDRIDRRLEHVGHLVRVEPEHIAQDEHGELARRQDLKSGHERQGDRLGLFVPSLGSERHVHHILEKGVGEGFEPDDLAHARRLGRFILGDVPLLGRASVG